ncbi:MATE family efflux transporter [Longimicrobium sp.]|uniref:MATE family efflux transporter n=1 Tax=Longimicrobium sp. TaxID=2029185 RepID=UPI002CF16954|nr:MATE family efflux transporter [Longimicrobium sp.]HSU17012.1 MATE family efflux transporter [Longimicrobium sp.]
MGTATLERGRPRGGLSPGGRRRRGRLFAHEVRQLLRLAGPIIVGQLGGVAMTTTDTIMVGPLGAASLAAAGLGSGIHFSLLVTMSGMLMGMTPLVSQSFGAGDRAECRRVAVQGIWLAVLVSIPITVASILGRPIALSLGQDPEVAALAGRFMMALAPGVLPLMLFMALRVYLDAMGRTRVAMTMMFVGVAVNVLGNRLLIYGVPGVVRPMGVVGSGLSTSIVRWAVLAVMGVYVARHPELSPFRGVRLRPVPARMRRIAAIGAPIGAQVGAEVGTFSFAAVMMGWLGPVQLAAHQVTINIASVTFMVAVGASAAGGIRVGHHLGAGSRRGVHRAGLATYVVAIGFMSLCALAFLLFPRQLIGLYTSDREIMAYGTALLFTAALFQVFDGAQVTGLSLLRGAADTRVPMWITLIGYWGIGIPVAYVLGFHTGMRHVGIWSGLVLSLAVVAVALLWRVRRVLWSPALAAVVPAPRQQAVEIARAEMTADAGAPVAGD